MPEDFDPGNMPEEGKSGEEQESSDASEDAAAPAGKDAPSGQNKEFRQQPGGFPNMSAAPQTDTKTAYILVGISALVLLIGIAFAWKYRR